MMSTTRRLLSLLSLILVIGGLAAYGVILKHDIEAQAEHLDAHHEMSAELNTTLYRLRSSLGYAGFINNFGHYVIRRSPRFLAAAKKQIGQAELALADYQALAVSGDERNALYTIRQVLDLHLEMIKLANADEYNKLPAEELGAKVQVDERLASLAMNKLADLARQRINRSEIMLAAEQHRLQQTFIWGLVGLPVLAFIGGLAWCTCRRPKQC